MARRAVVQHPRDAASASRRRRGDDVDDESGWHEILVDGWGPLVREAVCDEVERTFRSSRGVLAATVTAPDDAPAHLVERVHGAVLAAIALETGADLDALGSQAAWATYDDVWAELGRRAEELEHFEPVHGASADTLRRVLAAVPPSVVEAAGAYHRDDGSIAFCVRDDHVVLDVEGVHRWLATEDAADHATRQRARDLVELARRPT